MNIKRIMLPTNEHDPHKFAKDFAKTNFIWLPIFVLIYHFMNFKEIPNLQQFLRSSIIPYTSANFSFLGSILLFKIETYIYYQLRKESPKNSWGRQITLIIVLGTLGMYVGFQILGLNPILRDYGIGAIYAIIFITLYLGVDVLLNYKRQAMEDERKIKELEHQTLQAKLNTLTAQLNPHLLFNALNTIASTISDNESEKAEKMVVQLSELYRATLKATKEENHSLQEELQLCQSYLEIEHARFEDRLTYTLKVDQEIDPSKIKVPVLILQPIVENSVKHGIVPKREGGKISILISKESDQVLILIKDTGLGKNSAAQKGETTGMESCRSRLSLLFGSRAHFKFQLSEEGAETQISFPIKEN